MDINQSASAKLPLQRTGSDTLTPEQFANTINSKADQMLDLWVGEIDSMQLKGLFKEASQRQQTFDVQTKVRPNHTVPLRRDGDDNIFYFDAGEGWDYRFRTYTYAAGVKYERTLMEVDDVGAITDKYMWLMEGADRTVKHALADVINRSIKPTSAPVLCLDGMYLIDADRPNPDPKAPSWSNQEEDSDITEDTVFNAETNAFNTVGPNGEKLRLKIKKILIPQAYKRVAWVLANSNQVVGNANNDANWGVGNHPVEVMDDMTTNQIMYLLDDPQSEKNGLELRWRQRPGLADINFENPDVMGKRIRMDFGLGCLDPRYVWRGGLLNALA